MDKIYSRPRIKVFYSNNKKTNKKFAIIFVIIIAIVTLLNTLKSINPIFENLCKDKAMEISTKILNDESSKILKSYEYKDIVTITKADENNILKTDVSIINDIASQLALTVTNKLNQLENERIKIPSGAMLGNKYLSGIGPKIGINIIPSSNVTTEVKTEFKSQGMNQTIYRIYLEVVCNEKILTSYNTIETQIVNQVLLVETVIVGNVPETYYNLEGVDKENSIDIIE